MTYLGVILVESKFITGQKYIVCIFISAKVVFALLVQQAVLKELHHLKFN